MCCKTDHINGSLTPNLPHILIPDLPPTSITAPVIKAKEFILPFHYDRTNTFSAKTLLFFQRLELAEKIAEFVDEAFHLFRTLLSNKASVELFNTLKKIHHISHDLEHLLHSFCFIGDVSLFLSGNFFEYIDHKKNKFDVLKSAARAFHAFGHFLSSAAYLAENKLYSIGRLEKIAGYASLFNAIGYGIFVAALLWRKKNKNFSSDLGIHFGGFLFSAIPLTHSNSLFLEKVTSLAGITHASLVANRLWSSKRETFRVKCIISGDKLVFKGVESKHAH